MGSRGPSPTPTKVLDIRGSWRAKLNKREPKPEAKKPVCPAWLSPAAKRIWREAAKTMENMGVLTVADKLALARYCDAFARWIELARYIADHGEVYTQRDSDGRAIGLVPWPQVAIYRQLSALLIRFEDRFGLSPAARTRIAAGAEGSGNGDRKPNRWTGMAAG